MFSEPARPEVPIPHRPTVRIVKRRLPPQTALISLLIAAAAAAVAFGAWYVWRDDVGQQVVHRTIFDVMLPYRCERGHRFNAPGQAGPLRCPQCGTQAHAVTDYVCPIHGETEVAVEFALDAHGEAVVTKLSVEAGEWVNADTGIRCPRCGQALFRPQVNPLGDLGSDSRGRCPARSIPQ